MCTGTLFAEDIIDKITNLFYFTRRSWMFILKYIRVLEKIILLFLSTSEVIRFCLLPTNVWIFTVLLPFWNLSWDKLIKWRNVVVGKHESFRKTAHAVCISFSLSDKITYIFVPGLHPIIFMFLQTFGPLIQFYVLKGSVFLLHSRSRNAEFTQHFCRIPHGL